MNYYCFQFVSKPDFKNTDWFLRYAEVAQILFLRISEQATLDFYVFPIANISQSPFSFNRHFLSPPPEPIRQFFTDALFIILWLGVNKWSNQIGVNIHDILWAFQPFNISHHVNREWIHKTAQPINPIRPLKLDFVFSVTRPHYENCAAFDNQKSKNNSLFT